MTCDKKFTIITVTWDLSTGWALGYSRNYFRRECEDKVYVVSTEASCPIDEINVISSFPHLYNLNLKYLQPF